METFIAFFTKVKKIVIIKSPLTLIFKPVIILTVKLNHLYENYHIFAI